MSNLPDPYPASEDRASTSSLGAHRENQAMGDTSQPGLLQVIGDPKELDTIRRIFGGKVRLTLIADLDTFLTTTGTTLLDDPAQANDNATLPVQFDLAKLTSDSNTKTQVTLSILLL